MAEMTLQALQTQAHYQIEEMCVALQSAAAAKNTDGLAYLVQALVIRINDLNRVMMMANAGGADGFDEMLDAVFGSNYVKEVRHAN